MSEQQLYIPEKLKIGFKERKDTYTAKLGFITYEDNAGKLKKENVWKGWIDKKIPVLNTENTPTSGFVLNRNGGGPRYSYGHHSRNPFIRVYDPRDFEIEISVENLLFILRECDCSKGKGLEGEFVYAWNKQTLVLLPVKSVDYENSTKFTDLQHKNVSSKELKPGINYITKQQTNLLFLGKFDYYEISSKIYSSNNWRKGKSKKFVFWDGTAFVYANQVKNIASEASPDIDPNFAELVDKYYKSIHGSKAIRLYLMEKGTIGKDRHTSFHLKDGLFLRCHYQKQNYYDRNMKKYTDDKAWFLSIHAGFSLENGIIKEHSLNLSSFEKELLEQYPRYNPIDWIEPTNQVLMAELESGSHVQIH